MRGAVVALLAALTLAACGRGGEETGRAASDDSLCESVDAQLIADALGEAPTAATDETDLGSPHPGCTWMAQSALAAGPPRVLMFTVWRKKALDAQGAPSSGHDFFEEEVQALRQDYPRVGALADVGEQAFMGVGAASEARFDAKIVARKGEDVLSIKIDGSDPGAFEAVAKAVAERM